MHYWLAVGKRVKLTPMTFPTRHPSFGFAVRVMLRMHARRYARRLGPQLRRDYGASEYYTAEQIRAAAGKCRLSRRHLALGLAAFLPHDAFAAHCPGTTRDDYERLRISFFRHTPTEPDLAVSPAPENSYAVGGVGTSH